MEKINGELSGQCLHAKSLKFKHPITGKEMKIEAELPEYFKEILRQLGTNLDCFIK